MTFSSWATLEITHNHNIKITYKVGKVKKNKQTKKKKHCFSC